MAARRAELDGVVQQIGDDLLDALLVGQGEGGIGGDLDAEVHSGPLGLRPQALQRHVDEAADGHGNQPQAHLARLDLR